MDNRSDEALDWGKIEARKKREREFIVELSARSIRVKHLANRQQKHVRFQCAIATPIIVYLIKNSTPEPTDWIESLHFLLAFP